MSVSSDAAVLDEAVLDVLGRLRGKSHPELVDRLITMFMESALTLLAELKRGAAEDDITALHRASHTLKSCSATIGASRLADRCKELELGARTGCVPDAASHIDAITREYHYVQAALISRLAEPRNPAEQLG
jgi:HPt (histidine-containing phosphotransfer) domain-containing protein